jgi:hypothetical protein
MLPTPFGGFQAPPQQQQPSSPPAYAQPQAPYPPQPQYQRQSEPINVPKSRTGLVIGLVFAALVVLGGGLGLVFYLRRPKVDAIEPVATSTATATATATTTSAATAPTATTTTTAAATGTGSSPPVETQDAGAPAPAGGDAGAAAAGATDAGAAQEPAQVTITCIPDCDTAKIDDKPLATTDAGVVSSDPVELPPGPHTITVGKATFVTVNKRVTLKPGQKDAESIHLFKPGPAVAKPCGKFLERCPN